MIVFLSDKRPEYNKKESKKKSAAKGTKAFPGIFAVYLRSTI